MHAAVLALLRACQKNTPQRNSAMAVRLHRALLQRQTRVRAEGWIRLPACHPNRMQVKPTGNHMQHMLRATAEAQRATMANKLATATAAAISPPRTIELVVPKRSSEIFSQWRRSSVRYFVVK